MKSDFLEQFSTYTKASARVIYVPTDETYRAAEILREHAAENKMPYKEWDCIHGWREFKPGQPAPATGDNVIEFFQAAAAIDDVTGGYKNRWETGLFVMHYPHWMLKGEMPHNQLVQIIKQYARSFSASKQRLALLVPAGFKPPVEAQHEVAVCELALPSGVELREIFTALVSKAPNGRNLPWASNADQCSSVVNVGLGMTETEFRTAVGRAIVQNRDTWPNTPFDPFLRVVMDAKVEAVKRHPALSVIKPGDMSEVGGLENLKAWLTDMAVLFSEEAKEYGCSKPKGASLIGPPGTGKTLTAKAAGALLRLPIIRVDIGAMFNSLVGESEAAARDVCRKLEAMAPCIAFVDEVDKALGGAHQASGDSGVTKRILGYLLSFMSDCDKGIFWLFTANRTEGLDSALLRRGRLDKVFSVMPPNRVERLAILRIHLAKRNKDWKKIKGLEAAVEASNGFVAAEIEGAVEDAVRTSLLRKTELSGQSIVNELAGIKPIAEAFPEDFRAMTRWAAENACPASKPDDASTAPTLRTRAQPRKGGGGSAQARVEL